METRVEEIAAGVYRLSTFLADLPPDGFTFNQFLVAGDEPLLFHCGRHQLFPLVSAAVAKVLPIDQLKWISFGHVEADECGAVNLWLQAAPNAQVVNGMRACNLSLNDMSDRVPRALMEDEILDLGGKRMRWIDTPHVPHGWEAGVTYDETTGVLLSGDLFTYTGDGPALVETDVSDRAIASEKFYGAMSQGPNVSATLRRLAAMKPTTLALMHGSTFRGDAAGQLETLAAWSDTRA